MTPQIYENYWEFTAAYTDYNGDKFRKTLEIVVDFIDRNTSSEYSEALYKELQTAILKEVPKEGSDADASTRKAVNQLVKMGFVAPFLRSYHEEAKLFLTAKTNRKRQSILSRIVYSSSSLSSSITKETHLHQINFLIKTLEEVGKLEKDDIIALMLVDTNEYAKGYIDRNELNVYRVQVENINFVDRKYNQISHLGNLLSKLDDLIFHDDELYFTEDAKALFGSELYLKYEGRDMYLQRIYKNLLEAESEEKVGSVQCMVENLKYPSLVASHIKPYIKSNKIEAFDPNNGLLLSRNMDVLFDQGYISFLDTGKIIISDRLDDKLKGVLESYTLETSFINPQRLEYLKYHRELFREKLS